MQPLGDDFTSALKLDKALQPPIRYTNESWIVVAQHWGVGERVGQGYGGYMISRKDLIK